MGWAFLAGLVSGVVLLGIGWLCWHGWALTLRIGTQPLAQVSITPLKDVVRNPPEGRPTP